MNAQDKIEALAKIPGIQLTVRFGPYTNNDLAWVERFVADPATVNAVRQQRPVWNISVSAPGCHYVDSMRTTFDDALNHVLQQFAHQRAETAKAAAKAAANVAGVASLLEEIGR